MSETGLEAEAFEERMNAMKARTKEIARRVAKAAGYRGELMPGEIVRLKCGGPAMVIALFDLTSGLVHCQWIAGGRPYRASYWPELIIPARSDYMETPAKKPGPFARGANGDSADDPDTVKYPESESESELEDSPVAVKYQESTSEPEPEDSPDAAKYLEGAGELEDEESREVRESLEDLEALEALTQEDLDGIPEIAPMIRKLRADIGRRCREIEALGAAREQKRLNLPPEIRRTIDRIRRDGQPARKRGKAGRGRDGNPSQQE